MDQQRRVPQIGGARHPVRFEEIERSSDAHQGAGAARAKHARREATDGGGDVTEHHVMTNHIGPVDDRGVQHDVPHRVGIP